MKGPAVLMSWLFAIMALPPQPALAAFIEIPDEYLIGSEVSLVGDTFSREKRQVQIKGEGSEKAGFLNVQGQKNIYSDPKTSVDGTLGASSQWMKGFPTQNAGSARLDVQRNLYSSPNTQVNANAFAQRNVGTGSRPHDSYGAGLEVSRTLAKGRDGSLEAFAGYQRQWNTPDKHNANAGIRWRF